MTRKKSKKDDDEKVIKEAKKKRKEQEKFYKKHPHQVTEPLIVNSTEVDIINSLGNAIGYITNFLIKESNISPRKGILKWFENETTSQIPESYRFAAFKFDRWGRIETEEKLYDVYIGGFLTYPNWDSPATSIASVKRRVFPKPAVLKVGIRFKTGEEWWFLNPRKVHGAYHGVNFNISKDDYVPMDTVMCMGCLFKRAIPSRKYKSLCHAQELANRNVNVAKTVLEAEKITTK